MYDLINRRDRRIERTHSLEGVFRPLTPWGRSGIVTGGHPQEIVYMHRYEQLKAAWIALSRWLVDTSRQASDFLRRSARSFAVAALLCASAISFPASAWYVAREASFDAFSSRVSLTTAQVQTPTATAATPANASDAIIACSRPCRPIPSIRLSLFDAICLSIALLSMFALMILTAVALIGFFREIRQRKKRPAGH